MHAREKIAAEKFFRENPHKFAAKLFGKLKKFWQTIIFKG